MPRKAFVADLQEAKDGYLPDNIYDLRAGEDDGTFVFLHQCAESHSTGVEVQAHVADVGEYPSSHQYFVYTSSENVPPAVNAALSAMSVFDGLKVSQMVSRVAKILDKATAGSQKHPVEIDDDELMGDCCSRSGTLESDNESVNEQEEEEEDYEEYEDDFDEIAYGSNAPSRHTYSGHGHHAHGSEGAETSAYHDRVRADLLGVKNAGFRVSCLGQIFDHGRDCFVVVSCRIAKLGIPDDALQAWHLHREMYMMVVIHYTAGYRTLEELSDKHSTSKLGVEMRVGISSKHKLTGGEATDAFSQIDRKPPNEEEFKTPLKDKTKAPHDDDHNMVEPDNSIQQALLLEETKTGLRGLFIGRPLNELLNERLLDLIRYRKTLNMSWTGAEDYYNDYQGQSSSSSTVDETYYREETSSFLTQYPPLVTSDHLLAGYKESSFPLVAMQFTLLHVVRCTEFCLVCHCRLAVDFEALKPYVCSKPLCLYQYMALGFGPSIEHEILTQPYVVDLLISFCYQSALSGALADFPLGMGLSVPTPTAAPNILNLMTLNAASPHRHPLQIPELARPISGAAKATWSLSALSAKFDATNAELHIPKDLAGKPLRVGDWIVLSILGKTETIQHRRVLETWFSVVRLGPSVVPPTVPNSDHEHYLASLGALRAPTPSATPPAAPTHGSELLKDVKFVVYDQNFDDLTEQDKRAAICMLLTVLPSVTEMKEYLQGKGGKHMSLRNWTDRMSPAVLGVLRWIIASNRSCILQIDNLDDPSKESEDRVSGMTQYMQFRFAQGAPDKEQRFVTSVRDTSARLRLKYPTIFAFHGSPLYNWHGIVREGLHFNKTLHGRAFGNGVYHSMDASTSIGYSGGMYSMSSNEIGYSGWPQSKLRISQALCLNEIVNAPTEFVHHKPHLVVAQLDWIQTRYLFVKCSVQEKLGVEKTPCQALEQDPSLFPKGPHGSKLTIPITAISKSRRPSVKGVKSGWKKSKVEASTEEENLISDESDAEDRALLQPPSLNSRASLETSAKSAAGKPLSVWSGKKTKSEASKTDFVPGTLDHELLPLIAEPSYATSIASKALQRELKAMFKAQDSTPLGELGWYLDPELVTNVYQWILELHSFEPSLPLAKDMKQKGLKSVVLELRFGNQFPYTPPGGALCMELLTNEGWNPASNIEAVLLQVRLAMTSMDPKPARLEAGSTIRDYSAREAMEAFKRACIMHGWQIPSDFLSIS